MLKADMPTADKRNCVSHKILSLIFAVDFRWILDKNIPLCRAEYFIKMVSGSRPFTLKNPTTAETGLPDYRTTSELVLYNNLQTTKRIYCIIEAEHWLDRL
jgi:hypothetical protein